MSPGSSQIACLRSILAESGGIPRRSQSSTNCQLPLWVKLRCWSQAARLFGDDSAVCTLAQSDPKDGNWHMVTLSTQPYSFAGYRLFLDGEYVGELSGNSTAANGEGPVQVSI